MIDAEPRRQRTPRWVKVVLVMALGLLASSVGACAGMDVYARKGAGDAGDSYEAQVDQIRQALVAMPLPPVDLSQGSWEPYDRGQAVQAYKLGRHPLGEWHAFYECGDVCPGSWSRDEGVLFRLDLDVVILSDAQLCDRIASGIHERGLELEPVTANLGSSCAFQGVHDKVLVGLAVSKASRSTAALLVHAATRHYACYSPLTDPVSREGCEGP